MPRWPYRTLGTLLDRIFRNDLNSNFTDIASDMGEQKARVDNLITATPQPSEVVDARVSDDGTTYNLLKDRLDTEHQNVTSQLASIAQNVLANGLKGDGSDETSSFQTFLNNNGGKTILLPYGYSFLVNGITIPDNTTIFAYGAKLYNSTACSVISNMGNNVKIFGLEIQGKGNASYVDSDRGIQISGSYVSPTITYKTNIILEDCYIHDFGGYGVNILYGDTVNIERCRIENIGYAGILTLSSTKIHVDKAKIKGVSPGMSDGGQSYGVAFTRSASVTDLTQYPRTSDSYVINSTIENVLNWEGLDTHGGDNITFDNNTVKGCQRGIVLAVATGDSGTSTYGPQACSITNNRVYGNGSGYGVAISGTSTDYSFSCVIKGNKLFGCGQQTNANSGAIYITYTKSVVIVGNTFKNSYSNAICLYNENYNFTVNSNNIIDVQDSTNTMCGGITIPSNNNTGVIDGNNIILVDTTINTYVSVNGIYIHSGTTGVSVGIGINQITFSTPFWGTQQLNSYYGLLYNGVKIYCGNVAPNIVANIGSLYINFNGGTSTTFYVKESGNGASTGWVAK